MQAPKPNSLDESDAVSIPRNSEDRWAQNAALRAASDSQAQPQNTSCRLEGVRLSSFASNQDTIDTQKMETPYPKWQGDPHTGVVSKHCRTYSWKARMRMTILPLKRKVPKMKDGCFGCGSWGGDKIGVLIAQLGTPDAPTTEALKPYLKEFLSDPRVIETNRILWWFLLRLVILPRRPARSAALYKRIWTEEGSPLLLITQRQAEEVSKRLKAILPSIEVAYGMRYGQPSLEDALDDLRDRGCNKLLLFPMYPQYSAPTTASTYDAVFQHLLKSRFVPTLRVAEPYYEHPAFLEALATTINTACDEFSPAPERLILSYHGVPESYVVKGDPYCCMCTETTQALLPMLNMPKEHVIQTYQSRFGREPWLEPYTDDTIEALAKEGIKHIAVACPGFTTDCLETLDEMGNEAHELFVEHGGETLRLVPCLNDHPTWIDGMTSLIQDELGSWLKTAQRQLQNSRTITCPHPGFPGKRPTQISKHR